jgi:type I restriction enzyme R subunit
VREDFYEALTEFGMCLKVALGTRSFFEDASFSETQIQTYKRDLKFFNELRRIARQDAQETVDFSAYEDQLRKLVDRHVVGEEIKDADGVFVVNDLGKKADPKGWSEEKTRNETDIIRSRVKRTIEQELADDPYAQAYFSELLRQAIAEAEAMFEHPFKQYALFKDFEAKVETRDVDSVPQNLEGRRHASAFFGIMKLVGKNDPVDEGHIAEMADIALQIEEVVLDAVAENSLNPQNIEAAIRKGALPLLFKRYGLDFARSVTDKVVEVTRIGLARGDLR